jgi:hypothetical protein
VTFNTDVKVVETLKRKMAIHRTRLFKALDAINAEGGTNMKIGLSRGVEMMATSGNVG